MAESGLTFEEKQAKLEAIVRELEAGNVPLEKMIELYEQGEALYRDCAQTLDAYEKRLAALKGAQEA